MRFKPWSNSPSELWTNANPTDVELVDSWRLFLESPEGKVKVPESEHCLINAERAMETVTLNEDASSQITNQENELNKEDWMSRLENR